MGRVKSSGNQSTELKMIRVFKDNGFKGWRRNFPLEGKPDFVFPAHRLAVFVDGCFWHGHPALCRLPATNTEYWERKISRNAARDKEVGKILKKKGWRVMRVWEHEIDSKKTVGRLKKALIKG